MQELSVLDYDNYRSFLRAVLEQKRAKNPRFSLRAFARLAHVSPSHLSRALRGEKMISANVAHQISVGLNHSSLESDHLIGLIELEKARDDEHRGQILKRMKTQTRRPGRVLSAEAFRVIGDWYHFAIIALTNTRGFDASASWIARRLQIQPLDARLALERLQALELIEKTPSSWRAVNDAEISTTDDISSAAIKENHRQHLQLAQNALTLLEVELREFNNLTIAMNPSDVPKAKKMIRDFMDDFNREFKRRPGQEIFQLNIQYYRLSHPLRTDA